MLIFRFNPEEREREEKFVHSGIYANHIKYIEIFTKFSSCNRELKAQDLLFKFEYTFYVKNNYKCIDCLTSFLLPFGRPDNMYKFKMRTQCSRDITNPNKTSALMRLL